MSSQRRAFAEWYRSVSEDIFKFCEALRFRPTTQQRELLEAVHLAKTGNGPRRIAVKSGQGPGKTTASAVVSLWLCLQAEGALTIVTAPTMRQCRDVFLVELRRRVEAADPIIHRLFTVTKTKVEVLGKPDWGIKLVTATKTENAQGYHHPDLSVIGEEASGIPRDLITQFKGTLSNPRSLFILIGNPNTRDCAFFDCFNSQRSQWKCLTWNAEDTARDHPDILDARRNLELADEFGEESDVYRVRVKGEFPHADPNCVMSSDEVERCIGDVSWIARCARMERFGNPAAAPAKQFGMDFARFGGDESTVFQRSGQAIVWWDKYAREEPSKVVDLAFRRQIEMAWRDSEVRYVADASGIGQGVMGRFYDLGKHIYEFHHHATAMDGSRYANLISEAWFHMARVVRAIRCALPKDQTLVKQLSTRQYYLNTKGQLILESKEDYIKRGFESPDRADGIVYTFWDDVVSQGRSAQATVSRAHLGVGQ